MGPACGRQRCIVRPLPPGRRSYFFLDFLFFLSFLFFLLFFATHITPLEAAQVEAARKAGATWLEIGAIYGLTKQGAQQRFRAARKQAEAVDAAARGKTAEPAARVPS